MVAIRTAAVVALLVACSRSQGETDPCADELEKIVAPALERTLDGGDAETFHQATGKLTVMCGPDIAARIRDWGDALREPDAKKAATKRREVLVRLEELVSQDEWQQERRVLAGVIEKAKARR